MFGSSFCCCNSIKKPMKPLTGGIELHKVILMGEDNSMLSSHPFALAIPSHTSSPLCIFCI